MPLVDVAFGDLLWMRDRCTRPAWGKEMLYGMKGIGQRWECSGYRRFRLDAEALAVSDVVYQRSWYIAEEVGESTLVDGYQMRMAPRRMVTIAPD